MKRKTLSELQAAWTLGGRNSSRNMTTVQRVARARLGGLARAKMTPEERSEIARAGWRSRRRKTKV